jgi:hypothetical protein
MGPGIMTRSRFLGQPLSRKAVLKSDWNYDEHVIISRADDRTGRKFSVSMTVIISILNTRFSKVR